MDKSFLGRVAFVVTFTAQIDSISQKDIIVKLCLFFGLTKRHLMVSLICKTICLIFDFLSGEEEPT